jgi:hypothetical protein
MTRFMINAVSIISVFFQVLLVAQYPNVFVNAGAALVFTSKARIRSKQYGARQQSCMARRTFLFLKEESTDGGKNNRRFVDKTYDNPPLKKDVIDQEGAMVSFFSSREEWLPLFRSVAGKDLPKDTALLLDGIISSSEIGTTSTSVDIDIHESSNPWKRFNPIPQDEEHRTILARFLDSMQESLLAIPVVEQASLNSGNNVDFDEDENDLHFVEEGRRLLAINRFHVIPHVDGCMDSTTIAAVDALFTHCWSEILVLSQAGTVHSGSLILLPNQYELVNVRRFIEMNIIQPLRWLGVHSDFEISSFQRDSPAIRLIYKLNAIPATTSYTEEDGFAATKE